METNAARNQRIKKENQQKELQRKEHQKTLRNAKHLEWVERFKENQLFLGKARSELEFEKLSSSVQGVVPENHVYISKESECIVLPWQNKHVPLHIACFKKTEKIDNPGGFVQLLITFNTPSNKTLNVNILQTE